MQYSYRPFIVLTRSRTGSNMLIDMLRSHPQVHVKGEIFGNLHGRSIDSILDSVYCRKPDTIRAVGFKLFYYHPQDDDSGAIWTNLDGIAGLRIIHLKRKNVLRTLVSRKIAAKTNTWSEGKGTKGTALNKRVQFTPDELLELLKQTRGWEGKFGNKFAAHHMLDVCIEL